MIIVTKIFMFVVGIFFVVYSVVWTGKGERWCDKSMADNVVEYARLGIMKTQGMPDVRVEILEDMPNGLSEGDNPRYRVMILGTDKTCTPWMTSVELDT